MKFICNKDQLLNAINIVSKAVNPRTTLPILECILIQATSDGIHLTANDLEMGIASAPIPAKVDKEGQVALDAKLFGDIIRRVSGDEVHVEEEENQSILLTCGTSRYQLMGQKAEEFPALPEVEKNQTVIVKEQDLKAMIQETIFSVSMDESKPVLSGELMEGKDGFLSLVAVDGYRISYKKSQAQTGDSQIRAIIPAKTLREIAKIVKDSQDETKIYFTEKQVLFDIEGNRVVSRLIEGEYIKYEQTFSSDYKTKIVANRSDLIAALERATLVSRDARKVPVKFEITNGKLTLSASSEIGTAREEVYLNTEGNDLLIAFNPRYCIEALRAIEDEEVAIYFQSSLSPCILKAEEGDSYKYLILPLRL